MRGEGGYTLIEALVGSLLVAVGLVGTFTAFDASARLTQDAERHELALQLAQSEVERLRDLPWDSLGHTTLPVPEPDATPADRAPSTPAAYVDGSSLRVLVDWRDRASGPPPDAPAGTEPFVATGTVDPGPERTTVGTAEADVYRFVTWRDEACPRSGTGVDLCPGTQGESRRVTVAVVVDPDRPRPRKPVYATTVLGDPDVEPLVFTP